jgi:hypothetical protein
MTTNASSRDRMTMVSLSPPSTHGCGDPVFGHGPPGQAGKFVEVLDVAAWDALAKAARTPLARLLGEPHAALRNHGYLDALDGSPVRRHTNPITRCRDQTPLPLCTDRRRTRHRPNT